ncbi:PAP2 superfamily protein [Streptococcus mitis]|uniref:PAP2 superfamily protein n=1 Tax=Streptococcus mitis TaxID=28037 RepID=A0A081PMC3_STRMT|nr:phosphatase PAP2 family protein [Streptococcus mitis]KEQ31846.1 PAP2 superfamily protein [Streptococcus mitis]
MKNYQEWHDHIAGNIGNKPFLLSLLRTFNRFMTVVMPIIYLTLLAITYLQQGLGKQVGIYLFIPASGFVILSFLRKKINTPRPYEKWDIKPLLDRDSPGQSMPSRHVFSATIISMACLHASLTMGMICLTLSAFLGLVRVLGGVHYPKDVVVGYICGLVWGVIFFLF